MVLRLAPLLALLGFGSVAPAATSSARTPSAAEAPAAAPLPAAGTHTPSGRPLRIEAGVPDDIFAGEAKDSALPTEAHESPLKIERVAPTPAPLSVQPSAPAATPTPAGTPPTAIPFNADDLPSNP